MFIAIMFWLAVTVLGFFYVNKWHEYEDSALKMWHNLALVLIAAGTLSLIVKVIF